MPADPRAPSPIPAHYDRGAARKVWRGLEEQARAVLLVHGSKAYAFLKGCGESIEPHGIIAAMVEQGVLIPCKVDITGADPLALQYKNARQIAKAP